jgi:hypothetical protein
MKIIVTVMFVLLFVILSDAAQMTRIMRKGGSGRVTRATITQAPDAGTPVAYWKMTATGTNATQILDYSISDGSGPYAMSNMPSVASGPTLATTNGAFYSFDGADDHFLYRGSILPDNTNYTISAWIYLSSAADNYGVIYGEDNDGYQATKLRINPDGTLVHTVYNSGYNDVTSSVVIMNTNWIHVAATKVGTTGKLYINGVLNTTGVTKATLGSGRIYSTIGATRYNTSTIQYWRYNWKLDCIAIFTNALSDEQILNRYNLGRQ